MEEVLFLLIQQITNQDLVGVPVIVNSSRVERVALPYEAAKMGPESDRNLPLSFTENWRSFWTDDMKSVFQAALFCVYIKQNVQFCVACGL
jgi:hypothetical protein